MLVNFEIDLLHIADLFLKIICFYAFFIWVISLTMGKMVLGQANKNNFIVSIKFTRCFNIARLLEKMNVIFIELCLKGDCFANIKGK